MATVPSWLLFLLLALWGLTLLGWWRSATRIRRNNRSRQRVAAAGEADAERLLEGAGYTIDDRQVTEHWLLWIDDQEAPVHSRADLLVTRGDERFVAEVKTGTRAPDPTHPATRRQLLEYQHVFDVDGLLLVDMEARQVHEVRFWEAS